MVGRFAVDFVSVRGADGAWASSAIEINLRKGGTTAPYLILEYLVQGNYQWNEGRFVAPNGQEKFYVGDDHVDLPALRSLYLEEIAQSREEAFDFYRPKRAFRNFSDAVLWDYVHASTKPGEEGELQLAYGREWEAAAYRSTPFIWGAINKIRLPVLGLCVMISAYNSTPGRGLGASGRGASA